MRDKTVRSQFVSGCLAIVAGMIAAGLHVAAQPGTNDKFEAASIKPTSVVDSEPSSMVMPGGRYVATNVTLRRLLRTAYHVQEEQVVGGPAWLDTDRFDVNAIANRDMPTVVFREQFRPLLRGLLRDRFKILVHSEMRELRGYTLTLSRRDRTLGAQLHRSSEECVTGLSLRQLGRPVPPPPRGMLECGAWFSQPGHLEGRGVELGRLVETLAPFVERVVVDRTTLSGLFDWDLKWLDGLPGGDGLSEVPASIPAALEQQLGLKLESQKLRADVIVVDGAEQLMEN
jgi:uncharacterized protein (TIGR03435 family)